MDVSRASTLSSSVFLTGGNELHSPRVCTAKNVVSSFGYEDLKAELPFSGGGEWLRRRDGRGHGEVRVGAIQIARASLKKEGPANDGITPPKPNVEKNGNANPEVKNAEASENNTPGNVKVGGNIIAPPVTPNASSSRSGLFRTPISGGVQSATSSHGLPTPAIAVRNLIEQARFAHLCTIMSRMHHRRRGYPFGSLVDFATDNCGHPIFSLSPLAIHTRNLLADPRCTLVVQIPGWSGLANARVTLFGDVYPLPEGQQERAHQYYRAKHQQGASQQWSNFTFYRMENISDIYFVGGFGTVAWVDVKEYDMARPDVIAANGAEETLQVLNLKFSRRLRELLASEIEVDDTALISIDSKGVDIRVRQGAQFNVRRVSFEEANAVETLDQAIKALQKILDRGVHIVH